MLCDSLRGMSGASYHSFNHLGSQAKEAEGSRITGKTTELGKNMNKTFVELKVFQVKPDKLNQFEEIVKQMEIFQKNSEGCVSIRYFKRFYTIDGIELGEPPRELTKIVKCVKYYSYWEFDTKENYGKAIKTFFELYNRELQKLLIAPFDINLGNSI